MLANLPPISGTYTAAKPLAALTTAKVGGPAEVWADFADLEDLQTFLKNKPKDLPFTVLGEGSNVIIRDGGITGVVSTFAKWFTDVTVDGQTIHAQAGATCGKVARAAREAGLAGLAFYAGIPGSIGGALKMNAGCYGTETADVLQSIEVLTENGALKTLTPQDVGYSYRHSNLPAGWLFVGATYRLQPGDKAEIKAEMSRINSERRVSQPLEMPSSGSWFKNPLVDGHKTNAWKVVDAAGCRGWQQGGAQVSEKHCNFFVNMGNATAEDFEQLSQRVEAEILKTQGLTMQREVRFIGRN